METTQEVKILRVKSATPCKELAKSILLTKTKEHRDSVIVRAVGAGAISQMVKAVAVANQMLELDELPKITISSLEFKDVERSNRKEFSEESMNVSAIEIHLKF